MVDHGERISDEVKEADGALWPSFVVPLLKGRSIE